MYSPIMTGCHGLLLDHRYLSLVFICVHLSVRCMEVKQGIFISFWVEFHIFSGNILPKQAFLIAPAVTFPVKQLCYYLCIKMHQPMNAESYGRDTKLQTTPLISCWCGFNISFNTLSTLFITHISLYNAEIND